MAKRFNAELAEQIREKKYREVEALEQNRMRNIFLNLTDAVRDVDADDREAMLKFLMITADSLRAFEALPKDVRESLADGLEKMRRRLEEAKGFLRRGSGVRSDKIQMASSNRSFWVAYEIEHRCRIEGISRETAKLDLEEKSGMTDSVIHKYWKAHHKAAKASLDMIQEIIDSFATAKGDAPPPTRPRKRK